MDAIDVLRTKRDGGRMSPEQIRWIIGAYTDGTVPDGRTGVPPRGTTAGDDRSFCFAHNDRETFAQGGAACVDR